MPDYIYPCGSNKVDCHPIEVSLPKGKYKFELWGAQGGNISDIMGGYGGYSKGVITFDSRKKLYLFIGASGFQGTSNGFTAQTYNGGGRGTRNTDSYSSCSGGGSTDIRTSYDIDDRIIVAGGGGGAAYFEGRARNPGGSGGGIVGCDGLDGSGGPTNSPKGRGGKSNEGGSAKTDNRKGKKFYGGNQTETNQYGSGGGGGYYGGGAGFNYGATGGGGSGYINVLFSKTLMLAGNETVPNFYTKALDKTGNKGDGAIRITVLNLCTVQSKIMFHFAFTMLFVTYLS